MDRGRRDIERPCAASIWSEYQVHLERRDLGSRAFSRGGHWIAYPSDESGRNEVYVRPYPGPGGRQPNSTNGGVEPVWSRDGREILYRRVEQMLSVPVETRPSFSAGAPRVLFGTAAYLASTSYRLGPLYDVSPDGQRFLMVKSVTSTASTLEPLRLQIVLDWAAGLKK